MYKNPHDGYMVSKNYTVTTRHSLYSIDNKSQINKTDIFYYQGSVYAHIYRTDRRNKQRDYSNEGIKDTDFTTEDATERLLCLFP